MAGKVLLVDTNFSSRPIYDALCKRGFEVHVVGRNPSDALAKVSDHYWHLDYSQVERLEELIDAEGFDYIIPGCTDLSYSACAQVSQGRFPGIELPEVDRRINNKEQFRQLAQELAIRIPRVFSAEDKNIAFPVIVKPVDSFSGKGITVVETLSALSAACTYASKVSPSDTYVIEEFVAGQLYSISAFLNKRKITQEFIVREDSTVNPFVVDVSTVCSDTIGLPVVEVREAINRIAHELKLVDGLVHIQFIVADGYPYLIEMTRRCPGDLYSQLIELQTDAEYVENYICPFLGLPLNSISKPAFSSHIIRHTISAEKELDFNGIKYLQKVHLEKWVPLALTGDQLQPSPLGRVGVAFIRCDNVDKNSVYQALLNRELYELF